jgi:hypothetical protein
MVDRGARHYLWEVLPYPLFSTEVLEPRYLRVFCSRSIRVRLGNLRHRSRLTLARPVPALRFGTVPGWEGGFSASYDIHQ